MGAAHVCNAACVMEYTFAGLQRTTGMLEPTRIYRRLSRSTNTRDGDFTLRLNGRDIVEAHRTWVEHGTFDALVGKPPPPLVRGYTVPRFRGLSTANGTVTLTRTALAPRRHASVNAILLFDGARTHVEHSQRARTSRGKLEEESRGRARRARCVRSAARPSQLDDGFDENLVQTDVCSCSRG